MGVRPPGRGMFHITEAGHANLCGVVACLRGEKPPLREVGPTTGAVAARLANALSTALTVWGASKTIKAVANPV